MKNVEISVAGKSTGERGEARCDPGSWGGGPGEERQPARPPGSGKEKRGAIPQAGGGARGRSDSRRSPPDPVRRGAIERKEKRGAIPQAGGGPGGGATAGAPPRIR